MRDLEKIKAFLFDVDGVLTKGEIVYTNGGEELKAFNIKDGWAMFEVKKHGFVTGIITGRSSDVVAKRAAELKIDYLVQGELKKLEAYERFKQTYKFEDEEIAYIGDDLIDLPILVRCGFAVCPADAVKEVKKRVHLISEFEGGKGAAREMIEKVLKAQDKWKTIVYSYL